MRRLFIELDKDDDACNTMQLHLGFEFDRIIMSAGDNALKTWNAVEEYDEIYCSTALISQYFQTPDSPTLFNMLMFKATEEPTTGKSIFVWRKFNSIQWHNLRKNLFEFCFRKNNKLFVIDENYKFIPADIDAALRGM